MPRDFVKVARLRGHGLRWLVHTRVFMLIGGPPRALDWELLGTGGIAGHLGNLSLFAIGRQEADAASHSERM